MENAGYLIMMICTGHTVNSEVPDSVIGSIWLTAN